MFLFFFDGGNHHGPAVTYITILSNQHWKGARVNCIICTVRSTEGKFTFGPWPLCTCARFAAAVYLDMDGRWHSYRAHANIGSCGENTWAWLLLLCEMAVNQAGRRCLHPCLPLGRCVLWTWCGLHSLRKTQNNHQTVENTGTSAASQTSRTLVGGEVEAYGFHLVLYAITHNLCPHQHIVYCLP